MPRFTSPDGQVVREESNPTEANRLRAQGFTETKARTKAVREADAARPTNDPEAAS